MNGFTSVAQLRRSVFVVSIGRDGVVVQPELGLVEENRKLPPKAPNNAPSIMANHCPNIATL
jgi:hypothetical protein